MASIQAVAIPMAAGRAEAGKSLIDFMDNFGILENLVMDLAGKFTGKHSEFIKEARQMRIHLHNLEQGQYGQNHAADCKIMNLGKCW